MDTIIKFLAVALFGSFGCLIIKKHNPEMALALSVCVTVSVLAMVFGTFSCITELVNLSRDMLGNTSNLLKPIIKCMCIGMISKFGADICKDASNTSIASAVEIGGTLCAAATAMPLITSAIKLIGTMI